MATCSLKVTSVRKDGNIKPVIISDNSIQYNPLEDTGIDDPKLVEDMVRNIAQLDREGHEQIYTVIRKTKAKKFFATNNVDTRFNIYGLNPHERHELARTIQLCTENMNRKKVFEDANGSHRKDIARLDKTLKVDNLDEKFIEAVNPSEVDKIKEMLQMNDKSS